MIRFKFSPKRMEGPEESLDPQPGIEVHSQRSSWLKFRKEHQTAPGNIYKNIIFALISGAAGILIFVAAGFERHMALESFHWPITQGHIIKSYNNKYPFSWFSLQRLSFDSGPQVTYTYEVNGQQYRSYTIAWNNTWAQDHYDATKRFPVDTTVPVYYAPDNPRLSCLEIGNTSLLNWRFYGAILFVPVCFAAAAFFVFKCMPESVS